MKEVEISAVAFFLEIFFRNEAQRRRVDAVAHSMGCGAVGENVAQMRIGAFAAHFGAGHEQAAVGFFDEIFFLDGLGKAGPAAARIVLVGGAEQRLAGNDVDVDSFAVIVPIFVLKGMLGAFLLRHLVLQRRKLGFEFGVGGFLHDGSFHDRFGVHHGCGNT